MLIFTTHNVLTEKQSPLGYSMLCCLRSYLNLDMWVSMEVHTNDTISEGRQELLCFSGLIQVRFPFVWSYSCPDITTNTWGRTTLKNRDALPL
jgi:hypothetical protein